MHLSAWLGADAAHLWTTKTMVSPMTKSTDNGKPLEAFIAKKIEIDEILERLQTLSDEHFNVHPDEVHWCHVGTLQSYLDLLRRVSDSAFKEGEHAAG